LVTLEKVCFLKYAGIAVGDLSALFKEAEDALQASLAIDSQLTALFLTFRDLSPMAGGPETLEFTQELPEWEFKSGIRGATAAEVMEAKCTGSAALGSVANAEVCERVFGKCQRCRSRIVMDKMVLCGNCERWACCVNCRIQGCPFCGKDLQSTA
jgi:hypothetical protein